MVEEERVCCPFLVIELEETAEAVFITIAPLRLDPATLGVLFDHFTAGVPARPFTPLPEREDKPAGLVTATIDGPRGGKANQVYAAAMASCHCAAASARKVRSVDRETRWRCRLNVLWTAAWILRKRCADRADLNLCILRSHRRTT
jgi:hypothetical protein